MLLVLCLLEIGLMRLWIGDAKHMIGGTRWTFWLLPIWQNKSWYYYTCSHTAYAWFLVTFLKLSLLVRHYGKPLNACSNVKNNVKNAAKMVKDCWKHYSFEIQLAKRRWKSKRFYMEQGDIDPILYKVRAELMQRMGFSEVLHYFAFGDVRIWMTVQQGLCHIYSRRKQQKDAEPREQLKR